MLFLTLLPPLAGMLCLTGEQYAGQKPRNLKKFGKLKDFWPVAKRNQAVH